MHADKGTMSKVDYKTYTSLFEAMVMTPYFPRPDVLVYLEGDLESILDRIKKRGREMEMLTDRSYWEEMYTRYENWISGFNACPVVRVNIDEYDLFNNSASLDPIIEKSVKLFKDKQAKRADSHEEPLFFACAYKKKPLPYPGSGNTISNLCLVNH